MDGHSLHVTIDVIRRARVVGLHLLTLPSYCSHAMQPLEVAVFKLFKGAFMSTVMHGRFRIGTGGHGKRSLRHGHPKH
jgi:hypothetical protein